MSADPPNEWGQQAVQAPIFTSNVPVAPQIELSGNLPNNWKQWKQVWSAYKLVTRLNEQTDEYRVAAFIACNGPKALAIHNGLPFQSEDDKKNLAKILELWESYSIAWGKRTSFMKDIVSIIAIMTPVNQSTLTHQIWDLSPTRATLERLKTKW